MKTIRLCVAGEGAFGHKHLAALNNIENVEVVWLIGGVASETKVVATSNNIPNWSCDINKALQCDEVDGVILATPTPLHASQAKQVMLANKHVLVEIPMADNLDDSIELVNTQLQMGVIAMAGHVRRFNPSHQWIHKKIKHGELKIQQLEVQTYFFRRENISANGKPRSWVDNLLWHHACHSVDLFHYQTNEAIDKCYALQGPAHEALGIPMDMSIGLKTVNGSICNISLSFNNDGPFGTTFRYICDNGTFIANYDDLRDGYGNKIDLDDIEISNNGIELIDREFIQAIKTGIEPNSSLAQCLQTMKTLDRLEKNLS